MRRISTATGSSAGALTAGAEERFTRRSRLVDFRVDRAQSAARTNTATTTIQNPAETTPTTNPIASLIATTATTRSTTAATARLSIDGLSESIRVLHHCAPPGTNSARSRSGQRHPGGLRRSRCGAPRVDPTDGPPGFEGTDRLLATSRSRGRGAAGPLRARLGPAGARVLRATSRCPVDCRYRPPTQPSAAAHAALRPDVGVSHDRMSASGPADHRGRNLAVDQAHNLALARGPKALTRKRLRQC